MTEYIKVDKEQHGFVQRYVKEANISLNYLKDKGEDITDALENYRNVLSMIEAINRFNADHFEYDVTKAINTLKTYWDCGTMTPLTLKPDEFNNQYDYIDQVGYLDNIRCEFIKKRGDDIYNFKAYKAEINVILCVMIWFVVNVLKLRRFAIIILRFIYLLVVLLLVIMLDYVRLKMKM